MAWQNPNEPFLHILDYNSYAPTGNGEENYGNTLPSNDITSTTGMWFTISSNELPFSEEYLFDNDYKLQISAAGNGNSRYDFTFKCYKSSTLLFEKSLYLNSYYVINGQTTGIANIGIYGAYDETNHLAIISSIYAEGGNNYNRLRLGGSSKGWYSTSPLESNEVYKFLTSSFIPPITYNWQSVPSISGKNGILSLSTINDSAINNGNPVTGATSDTFHSVEDSKVEELVTYATPIDSSKLESFTCVYQATPPFAALKLLVKKNSAPQDEEDADLVVNLPNPVLSTGVDEYTATNLEPLTNYFCVVQVSDNGGHYKYSDPAEVRTGFMDRNFDYTGSIQTFVAPKTGIYQLETWGAQGGNASDGTLTARGGYGAYAVGEVLLTQGEKLYINVGGQNGYGGGGNYDYDDYMIVEPDANGYILDAHAASDGFHDRISGRKMKVIDGNFDNFTYDSTNDWITFGQGCDSLFGFLTKIPEDLIMSISAIDFELEGKWTQTCSSSALKFLGRITLQSDRETYGGTMDCVFVRGGHADAPALTLTRQNNGSPYWQTVFDSNSVVYDGIYDHWKNLEEVITYHMDLSNGVVTYSSQHCTQGVGAGTRIRANDSDYNNIILNSGNYLKIVCGSLQGFNARAYRIKVTQ